MKTAVALALAATTALALSGCGGSGPDRSANAFCATFRSQAISLHDKYEDANQAAAAGSGIGALTGLATIVQAPGDMVVMFDHLDKVAPDDIEPSVAEALSSLRKEQDASKDAFSNPLGALGSGLLTAVQSGGAFRQVDDYLADHCDLSFEK